MENPNVREGRSSRQCELRIDGNDTGYGRRRPRPGTGRFELGDHSRTENLYITNNIYFLKMGGNTA